jgi:hypothetical protein
MDQDEELHEQLMHAFREYFKANVRWVSQGTKRAGMDTRYWLNEIKNLSLARRKHIMEWREWKNADWEVKKAQRKERKAQKEAAQKGGDDN